MFTLKQELGTLLLIFLFSVVGVFFIYQNKNRLQAQTPVTIPEFVKKVPTISPIPTPTTVKESETQISSDGKMKVEMITEIRPNKTKTYSFFVFPTNGDAPKQLLFSKDVRENISYAIPFNTFSTKNKYLFIKETVDGQSHFPVYQTSGQVFGDNEEFLEVRALFEAYNPDYTLTNVTGWASETMLILQTSGPSFWFDVPSRRFTRLSSKF